MEQTIKLYALSTCPACKKTKALLETYGIPFDCTEVDLLEGSSQWAATTEIKKHNPNLTFPTLLIGDIVIVGFDEEKIKQTLCIK